jgi:two-component system OmpR family response regulator
MEKIAIISVNNLTIDAANRRASLGNGVLDLTPKEFDLLAFLAGNKGLVFSRKQLLKKVWGYDYAGDTRTVDVHIRWLRKKIETDPAKPERILTVRSVGYKLEG